ncbi:hypothetical protein EGW08_018257, partial [Elysia chlorotica]
MRWQALLFFISLAELCFGGEDLPGSIKNFLWNHASQRTCHWPGHIYGQWDSSLWRNLTVSGSDVHTYLPLGGIGVHELRCSPSSDPENTILRGRKEVMYEGHSFVMLTCVEFVARNEYNYHLIVKTERDAVLRNEPLKLRPVHTNESIEELDRSSCDTHSSTWLHGDMIQKGQIESAAVTCPSVLIGKFSLTFADEVGMLRCPNGAVMSSGASDKSIIFDYSGCLHNDSSQVQDAEVFWCVGLTTHGYVSMYREEGGTGSFSCVALEALGSYQGDQMIYKYKQTPGTCGDTWVSNSHLPEENQTRIAFLTSIDKDTNGRLVTEDTPSAQLDQNKVSKAIKTNCKDTDKPSGDTEGNAAH